MGLPKIFVYLLGKMKFFHSCSTFCICIELFPNEVKPDLTLQIPMRDGMELTTDVYLPLNPKLKTSRVYF